MNRLIAHRGPDDEGYFYGPTFAFGHRRLSIIDISPAGHQPMEAHGNVLTFNGEIFNYLELREELRTAGFHFKSNTDSEVILAAYSAWGDNCVRKFNGMWSFALYDAGRGTIFCSRDRFGIKPFYYVELEDAFAFGSEIKQLLHLLRRPSANMEILLEYLVTGISDHTEATFFEGVRSLPAGHNLYFDLNSNSFSLKRYYELPIRSPMPSPEFEEAVGLCRSELTRSVELRMRSDVRVGTCLSGGLDSSSVAAIASVASKGVEEQKFCAIHARSSESDSDESRYASRVSVARDIDLHIVSPTFDDFRGAIDSVFYAQEEPFSAPSIFMQYFVMKEARDLGCKVMLDGQGGDEVLMGYERYYPAYLLSLPWRQKVRAFFLSSRNSRLTPFELLAYCFYFTMTPIRRFRLRRRYWFLKRKFFGRFAALKKMARAYLNIDHLQRLEISSTQLPHLLRYEDRNSMAHSVEARLPFLDYQLLETFISLPHTYKIKEGWTKYVLRAAMKDLLPADVVWRKDKLGFNAPDRTWIGEFRDEIDEAIRNSCILKHITKSIPRPEQMDDALRWRLFSIAKWEEIFGVTVGQSPS